MIIRTSYEDEGGINELYGKSNDHYYLHNNRAFMQ